MALINCPECNNQVSDQANNCPKCGYAVNNKRKKINKKKMLTIVATIVIIIISIIAIINIIAYVYKPKTTKSKYTSNYNYNYVNTSKLSASLDLYISNVNISSNSSYTIATGTIKNNGTKTYKSIKVKGAFKNSSGSTIDTDWTYAIGSEGLAPGESKSFRLSVKKNSSIKKCTVTIID